MARLLQTLSAPCRQWFRAQPAWCASLAWCARCASCAMVKREEVSRAIMDYLATELVEKLVDGGEWPTFPSVAAYLACHYPTVDDWAGFGMAMQLLEMNCRRAVGAQAEDCLTMVPSFQKQSDRYSVKIWTLSCAADACPRGAAPTHCVLEKVKFILSQGCLTHMYPVQVFFDAFGLSSGEAVPFFKIGICVGMATVTACFLIAHCRVKVHSWPNFHGSVADVAKALGCDLLSIFHVTVIDGGSGIDTMGKIRMSLGEKLLASGRRRPSPLEMYRALRPRAVELEVAQVAQGGHQGHDETWSDVIMEFRECVVGQDVSLLNEEVICIKLLARCDEEIHNIIEARDLRERFEALRVQTNSQHTPKFNVRPSGVQTRSSLLPFH